MTALTSDSLDAEALAVLPQTVSTVIARPGDLPVAEDLTYAPAGTATVGDRVVLVPEASVSEAAAGILSAGSDSTALSALDARGLLRGQLAILTRQTPYRGRDIVVAPLTRRRRRPRLLHHPPNGEDVESLLHSDAVDAHAAQVSCIVPLRHIVNEKLRSLTEALDFVCEGRDMTTVVFPSADYKFYLDASIDAQAERRFKQSVNNLSLEQIKETIIQRDAIDKAKSEGALKIASDACYIDTTHLRRTVTTLPTMVASSPGMGA